jgi:hypothetical protein
VTRGIPDNRKEKQVSKSMKKLLLTVGALAAFAVGGTAIADAASSQGTTAALSTTHAQPSFPAHGTAAHEDAENAVTGSAAAKAQAAAVKLVGSGTAGAVTTDYFGTGYEVTVTKSDGSTVEVHLDSSFNAIHGPGAPNGPPPAA